MSLAYCLLLTIKRQNYQDIETSQLICRANQLTGFDIMATFAFNELNKHLPTQYALKELFKVNKMVTISINLQCNSPLTTFINCTVETKTKATHMIAATLSFFDCFPFFSYSFVFIYFIKLKPK